MKQKFFLIAVLALFCYSCTSQEPDINSANIEDSSQETFSKPSQKRSLEEAATIARDAISMFPVESRTSVRNFSNSDVKILYSSPVSRGQNPDTLMYVFNFDDEQGFAIVAANRHSEPLIAVTEQGHYIPGETIENPGFADYMARAESRANREWVLDTTKRVPFDPVNPELTQYRVFEETLSEWKIEPNYNLKWGQTHPEGLLFTNGFCGCTNTAMAIIMTYFNQPKTLDLTFDGRNETIALNWSEIKHHTQSVQNVYLDSCTILYPSNHTTISYLTRQLAELNESVNGGINGTLTYNSKTIPTFKKFGYKVTEFKDFSSNLVSEIAQKNILLVSGENKTTGTFHNWVIDGASRKETRISEWTKEYGKEWERISDYTYMTYEFCHCNWGYDGDCNGWFSVKNTIDTAYAQSYDGEHANANKIYFNLKYLPVKF